MKKVYLVLFVMVIVLSLLAFAGCNAIRGADGADGADGTNGRDGQDGRSAYQIAVDNGYTGTEQQWLASLTGADGITPTISINNAGYWVINGEATTVLAKGVNGTNGTDGHSPVISVSGGYWYIDGVATGVKAEGVDGATGESAYQIAVRNGYTGTEQQWLASLTGADGITPTISINNAGYWVINGEATTVLARGTNGADGTNGSDGHSPVISVSGGYWYIDGVATGVKAEGRDGVNGISAYQVAVANGYIGTEAEWLASLRGADGINGTNGTDGMSIYQLYVATYGYTGTEAEWLSDVTAGTLGTAQLRTVTFDYNGASCEGLTTSIAIVDGRTLALPVPAREGYDFLGWYTGNGVNDGQWTDTLVVNRDLDLVARWQQQSVIVRYLDKDDVLLSEQIVSYGSDSTPPTAPAVASYAFSHWDGATTQHKSDVALRPVYVAQRYTVSYDTDGGTAIQAASYLFTETPNKPLNPQKSGWVFDGWVIADTDEAYTFDVPFAADTTLLAKWTDTIKIYTAADLVAMADDLNANYTLANDINLDGAEWTPLGTFAGTLDGAGHKIHNFQMTIANTNLAFIQTNNGTIRNITFEDVVVSQSAVSAKTAVVTGVNNGRLNNILVTDVVVNYSTTSREENCRVAGLSAENSGSGIIEYCALNGILHFGHSWSNASGTSTVNAGGMVAYNIGSINNVQCVVEIENNVYAKTPRQEQTINIYYYLGGICGYNVGVLDTLICSVHMQSITTAEKNYGSCSLNQWIGGIAGRHAGNMNKASVAGIIDCQAKGNSSASGDNYWGGIVGGMDNGTLSVAYTNVELTGTQANQRGNIGGVVGDTGSSSSVRNVWFDGVLTSTSISNAGGIIGCNRNSLTSAYMTGDISVSNANSNRYGMLIGLITSGVINKIIIDSNNFSGTGIGENNGTLGNKMYSITDANKLEIYNEDYLYDNDILSREVWGVREGESVYLYAFE